MAFIKRNLFQITSFNISYRKTTKHNPESTYIFPNSLVVLAC